MAYARTHTHIHIQFIVAAKKRDNAGLAAATRRVQHGKTYERLKLLTYVHMYVRSR